MGCETVPEKHVWTTIKHNKELSEGKKRRERKIEREAEMEDEREGWRKIWDDLRLGRMK